jgi:hypothetical protein
MNTCPGCGADLEFSIDGELVESCSFCGWSPRQQQFPETDPEVAMRHAAETLPLPKGASEGFAIGDSEQPQEQSPGTDSEQAATEDRSGPEHFRELIRETESDTGELLEQVPEEMREVLAERIQPSQVEKPEFRKETVEQLRNSGYQVTEDQAGARITAVPQSGRTPEELSPSDVVRMAAELEGGVKPSTKLPMCTACQSASPVGSTTCQWCGEPLPPE